MRELGLQESNSSPNMPFRYFGLLFASRFRVIVWNSGPIKHLEKHGAGSVLCDRSSPFLSIPLRSSPLPSAPLTSVVAGQQRLPSSLSLCLCLPGPRDSTRLHYSYSYSTPRAPTHYHYYDYNDECYYYTTTILSLLPLLLLTIS